MTNNFIKTLILAKISYEWVYTAQISQRSSYSGCGWSVSVGSCFPDLTCPNCWYHRAMGILPSGCLVWLLFGEWHWLVSEILSGYLSTSITSCNKNPIFFCSFFSSPALDLGYKLLFLSRFYCLDCWYFEWNYRRVILYYITVADIELHLQLQYSLI